MNRWFTCVACQVKWCSADRRCWSCGLPVPAATANNAGGDAPEIRNAYGPIPANVRQEGE